MGTVRSAWTNLRPLPLEEGLRRRLGSGKTAARPYMKSWSGKITRVFGWVFRPGLAWWTYYKAWDKDVEVVFRSAAPVSNDTWRVWNRK